MTVFQPANPAPLGRQPGLLRIPPEIRLKIYDFLAGEGKITVRECGFPTTLLKGRHVAYGLDLDWNLEVASSLNLTCKTLSKESLARFHEKTTRLVVPYKSFYRAIRAIPQSIKDHITSLELDTLSWNPLYFEYLPNLKTVSVTYEQRFLGEKSAQFLEVCEKDSSLLAHITKELRKTSLSVKDGPTILIEYRAMLPYYRHNTKFSDWAGDYITVVRAYLDLQNQRVVSKKVKARDMGAMNPGRAKEKAFAEWSDIEDED